MSDFDYIVFDLGGVLVDVDEEGPARQWAAACGREPCEVWGAVFSPERKAPLETGRQSWEEFSAAVRAELGLRVGHDEFTRVFRAMLTPKPEMPALVRAIGARHALACCSNTSSVHWDVMRALPPVQELFDPQVVSHEAGCMKPGPEIYGLLADRCGVPPGRILFIDDAARNVEGALAAGLAAIRFTGADALRRDLRRMGVEVTRDASGG